jgi:hypothetical protein
MIGRAHDESIAQSIPGGHMNDEAIKSFPKAEELLIENSSDYAG